MALKASREAWAKAGSCQPITCSGSDLGFEGGSTCCGLQVVASRFRLGPGWVLCLLGFCHAWSMTPKIVTPLELNFPGSFLPPIWIFSFLKNIEKFN